MRPSLSLRRLVRRLLAIVFAVCATMYSVLWIMHQEYVHPQPGFTDYEYSASSSAMQVGHVFPGSPAEKAGLRPGDRIIAIDGQPLADLRPFYQAIIIGHQNVVELTVERTASAAEQRQIRLVVGGGRRVPPRTIRPEDLLGFPIDFYPLGFLVVGVAVLLLRPDDQNAWLLALLFGGFLAVTPFFEGNFPTLLRGFAVFYKIVMSWASLALFYYFFAVFPASSPIDRKIPWLKYLLLAVAIITAVPIGVRCLFAGGTLPLFLGLHWPGTSTVSSVLTLQAGLPSPASQGWLSSKLVLFGSFIGALTLGMLSLISNNFLSPDAQVRRKAHVMLWGTVIGVGPVCLVAAIVFVSGVLTFPLVLWQIAVLLLLSVWPLSFAYAVVKHRVLEIPVLLKRSARYVLVQRGYIVLLFVAAAIAIAFFTHAISRFFPEGSNIGMVVSAVFGIVLFWSSAPLLPRSTLFPYTTFFRTSYDARIILQDLAENARTVTDRHELASLLENKIAGALHPKSLECYIAAGDGN